MCLFQDLGLGFEIQLGVGFAQASRRVELTQQRLHLGPDLIRIRSGSVTGDIVRGGHRAQG